ncbi:hypothetical protein ONA00_02970 [Mycoplasmopsis cynos]|uniref:hypothetical protein n=1 Tax=Mycoplasmopsis cynos TaxID=171284 RepID=UPI0024CD6CAB|nr:hypothetical protein [Mycoplasmopsis cynos]WAM11403.1 hypothetical protein ONA00_02970 [Mycoplasmopsis cynos]
MLPITVLSAETDQNGTPSNGGDNSPKQGLRKKKNQKKNRKMIQNLILLKIKQKIKQKKVLKKL